MNRASSAYRGPLRDNGQRQRFAHGEPRGRFAEIDAARGAGSLDVAAEGNQIEIRFEQVALRISRLQPNRGADLSQLAHRGPGSQMEHEPGQLHGQSGTALTAR